jgi:hypothetical protein
MRPARLPLLALATILLALTGAREASACACCSNAGQRLIEDVALDGGRLETIRQLGFARDAYLYLGESDVDTVQGIASPSSEYFLTAARQDDRLVFSLRDRLGHAGTLTLARPRKLGIFEIDPRDAPDAGLGPLLYKEWTLRAPAAGSGVFAAVARNHEIRLILHGRGRGCTGAQDFTHWTLQITGPTANFLLFGALTQPPGAEKR